MITELSSELRNAVEQELRNGDLLDQIQARAQQHVIGRANHRPHRSIDGLGQKVASVDVASYHHWGQRLGYACWKDKQFVGEYLRDNPQARVISGGTRPQVGYTAPRNVRYTKSYAAA